MTIKIKNTKKEPVREKLETGSYQAVKEKDGTTKWFMGDEKGLAKEIYEEEYNKAVFGFKSRPKTPNNKAYSVLLFNGKGSVFLTVEENDRIALFDSVEMATAAISKKEVSDKIKDSFFGFSVVEINLFQVL